MLVRHWFWPAKSVTNFTRTLLSENKISFHFPTLSSPLVSKYLISLKLSDTSASSGKRKSSLSLSLFAHQQKIRYTRLLLAKRLTIMKLLFSWLATLATCLLLTLLQASLAHALTNNERPVVQTALLDKQENGMKISVKQVSNTKIIKMMRLIKSKYNDVRARLQLQPGRTV